VKESRLLPYPKETDGKDRPDQKKTLPHRKGKGLRKKKKGEKGKGNAFYHLHQRKGMPYRLRRKKERLAVNCEREERGESVGKAVSSRGVGPKKKRGFFSRLLRRPREGKETRWTNEQLRRKGKKVQK